VSQGLKSLLAISNLRAICREHLHNRYHIEVIDLAENPSLAIDHPILAIPTLVPTLPVSMRKIIGTCQTRSGFWLAWKFRQRGARLMTRHRLPKDFQIPESLIFIFVLAPRGLAFQSRQFARPLPAQPVIHWTVPSFCALPEPPVRPPTKMISRISQVLG